MLKLRYGHIPCLAPATDGFAAITRACEQDGGTVPLNWRIVLAGILVGMFSLIVLPSIQFLAYGGFAFVWGVFLRPRVSNGQSESAAVRAYYMGYIFLIALVSMLCVGLLLSM